MGSAAAGREDKKVEKYSNLSDNYHFVSVGIETYGAYSPLGIKLVKEINKKMYMKLKSYDNQSRWVRFLNFPWF